MSPYHYAGWFVVDVKLLLFCVVCSLLFSAGIVAGFLKTRKWHEHLTAFVAIFAIVLTSLILVFNYVVSYPIFMITSLFQFP